MGRIFQLNPITGKFDIAKDSTLFTLKGVVDTTGDLPLTGNSENDLYVVKDGDRLYTWNKATPDGILSDWVDVGSVASIDWSIITNKPASTVSDIDDAVVKKHDRQHGIDVSVDHNGVAGAVADNFVAFDSNGLPKDSGKSAADFVAAGAEGLLSGVQIRRTTAYTFTSSWVDIPFDTTDIETDISILEHDNTNTDRIQVKADGLYKITYGMAVASSSSGAFRARLRKNDTTVILGSESHMEDANDANELSNAFLAELSSGDFITLQLQNDVGSGEAVEPDIVLTIVAMSGIKGERGDTGAPGGSDVDIEEDDVAVAANVITINFEDNIDVIDEGGGKVTVKATGGAATKDVFFYATYDASLGYYQTQHMSNGSTFEFNFRVPQDFTTIDKLVLVFAPNSNMGAGDQAVLNSHYAGIGELYNQHAESNTIPNTTPLQNKWTELDISSVFSSLAAGDFCGLSFQNDTNGGTLAQIEVLGIRLKYS